MKSTNIRVEPPAGAPHLTVRLSSTARGARLARRLAGQQLVAWGVPYDSETSQATDTRPGQRPRHPAAEPAAPDVPSGRGLLLVTAYTERWGYEGRDAYTKAVWAEIGRPT